MHILKFNSIYNSLTFIYYVLFSFFASNMPKLELPAGIRNSPSVCERYSLITCSQSRDRHRCSDLPFLFLFLSSSFFNSGCSSRIFRVNFSNRSVFNSWLRCILIEFISRDIILLRKRGAVSANDQY